MTIYISEYHLGIICGLIIAWWSYGMYRFLTVGNKQTKVEKK